MKLPERALTPLRIEKVKTFLRKCLKKPGDFGYIGSVAWCRKLILDMEESGLLLVEHVRLWMETHRDIFPSRKATRSQEKITRAACRANEKRLSTKKKWVQRPKVGTGEKIKANKADKLIADSIKPLRRSSRLAGGKAPTPPPSPPPPKKKKTQIVSLSKVREVSPCRRYPPSTEEKKKSLRKIVSLQTVKKILGACVPTKKKPNQLTNSVPKNTQKDILKDATSPSPASSRSTVILAAFASNPPRPRPSASPLIPGRSTPCGRRNAEEDDLLSVFRDMGIRENDLQLELAAQGCPPWIMKEIFEHLSKHDKAYA